MAERNAALWRFACELYRGEGVSTALLELQDQRGLDIPLFIFLLWAGCCGRALETHEIVRLVAISKETSASLVKPVRDSRKWLKLHHPDDCETYQLLLQTELACERKVFQLLNNELSLSGSFDSSQHQLGVGNCEAYLTVSGINQKGSQADQLATVYGYLNRLPAMSDWRG